VISVTFAHASVTKQTSFLYTLQILKNIMPNPVNNDNKYPVGTVVYARVQPDLKLVIEQYMQRIYFCGVSGQPGMKQLPYFERELIIPGADNDAVK